jgi:hypothetical protein
MHLQAKDDLPEDLFVNPVWHALRAKHRRFANSTADACRYPADVVPFAAINPPSAEAIRKLHALLASGKSTWLSGEQCPRVRQLTCEETLPCFQMVLPSDLPGPVPRLISFHSPARTHKRWSLSPRSRFPVFPAAGRAKWARTAAFAAPPAN